MIPSQKTLKFIFTSYIEYIISKVVNNYLMPKMTQLLKIENKKFVMKEIEDSKLRMKLHKDSRWKNLGNDSYATTDLGAASIYKKFADERVEKLFKKTFQCHYELPYIPKLPGLDSHQIQGIEWILTRKRSYLAHAPGAGKTAQAIIASSLAEGFGQTLFIVPPSLTKNWEREILKFMEYVVNETDFPTIGIIQASTVFGINIDLRSDFIICSDTMIVNQAINKILFNMKKKFIAVDEASRFKESLSKRSIALYGGVIEGVTYPGLIQDAHHVVFMDGSPMPNRPIELWAPTYALHPEAIDCMDIDDFGYRYCGAKPNAMGIWEYKYSSHEEELKNKLQKDFMHVVKEEELTHPDRLRSMVIMNEDVRTPEIKEFERRHHNYSEELSQGKMAEMRKLLGLRKIKWVADYVKEKLEEKNESIILFAWHREVVDKLSEYLKLYDPVIVRGGVDSRTRDNGFNAFNNERKKLIIGNIAAMGRGHNLQKASRCIFGEFSWSDETNKQAEKRASRKGSTKEFVRCEYIVCPNSMDEIVLNSIFTKEKRVEKVIG